MKLVYKGKRRTDGKITLFHYCKFYFISSYFMLPRKIQNFNISTSTTGLILFGKYAQEITVDCDGVHYKTIIEIKNEDDVSDCGPIYDIDGVDLIEECEVWYDQMKLEHALPVENIKTKNKEKRL